MHPQDASQDSPQDCWIQHHYSRLLVDNHITDLDEGLMREYSSQQYADLIADAGFSSAMVYACDHNGNCYYPTKVGHQHRNLQGKDLFGEVVGKLRERNVLPVAYTTVIYHNHSAKNHPAWRMQDIGGLQHDGRYWYSCPNHPDYAAFALDQLREVMAYPVAGVFIDMTFWPLVCTCPSCRGRYRRESGKEIPETIDWTHPEWVSFQRARERWMVEFSETLSGAVRREFTDKTVTLQNSPILTGWSLAQTRGISAASDYASGDFYGGRDEHRFGAKVMSAHSGKQPFEFMTSRCIHLFYHTTTRSEEELTVSALTTLAHGGACLMIDAINPDGTLEPRVYERFGNVLKALRPWERILERLQPVLEADTGLYFSMRSFVHPHQPPLPLARARERCTHMDGISKSPVIAELTGTSRLLTRSHIPHRVIPDDETDLSSLKTLFLLNAVYLSDGECEHIRAFVREGGTLVATGLSSLRNHLGEAREDFGLAEVFGVSYSGQTSGEITYLHDPRSGGKIVSSAPCPLVNADGADILAYITPTLYPPFDPERYASIHSNPWGEVTDYAAVTTHAFGKGRCIYLAQDLLRYPHDDHREYLQDLLLCRMPTDFRILSNLPPCVEANVLRSSLSNTRLLTLVNCQPELPTLPLHHLEIQLDLPAPNPVNTVVHGCPDATVAIDGYRLKIRIPELTHAVFVEIISE